MKRSKRINIDVRRGGYTLEELDRMRRKLAKRANARLLSLEERGVITGRMISRNSI